MSANDLERFPPARPVRALTVHYLVRVVFSATSVVILINIAASSSASRNLGLLAAALLVIYPISDVLATVFDIRATPSIARRAQRVNVWAGIGAAAAIAATAPLAALPTQRDPVETL